MKKKMLFVFIILLCARDVLIAQRWAAAIEKRPSEQLTFKDYQRAFEEYYAKNPVDMRKESVSPKFIFRQGDEENDKVEIEEHKLFKRWEWFTEPRVYPSGRWEFDKIEQIRKDIDLYDERMIISQRELNPLKVRFVGDKIFYPFKIWTPLGPNDAVGGTNMGRVNCIEFNPKNAKTVFIGSPGGGIWRSYDGGTTWSPRFDAQPTLSVGDIAIDKSDSNKIYVATSDAFGYGNPFWGGTYSVGVMKSADGGNTWSATGLSWTVSQNRTIRRLVIHPTNGKILLAATSNGLYRTADGGATWTQLWATSTYDVEFQQDNGKIVYATTNQVMKSTDEGATFAALTATCPGSRYNIEIAKSNPKTLYTLCTNGTVQKSTDAGATWSVTTAPGVTLYGYYDNVLAVSPVDANLVYVAGFNIRRSTNGGTSWAAVTTAGHVDNHCIEFFPSSSSNILCGNDGGIFKTTNSAASWSSLNKTLAITQFYRLGLCKSDVNTLICGAQDNGNMKLSGGAFTNITNADGMEGFIDWSNCKTMYAGIQYGGFYRSTDAGATFVNINTPAGGAWVAPWCQDPVTANTIYAGTNRVYKSTNQGTAWTDISGALAGIGTYTVLEVAKNPKVIYAGDGNTLYRTTNAGATWTNITAGLPVASNFLMDVAINDNNPDMAWAVFSGYVGGNKVYKTKDGGATWSNISGTIPNMPVNCVVYENNIKNAVYIGTDAGVYYINDGLADWVPYKFGLPNVIVDELEIHYGGKKIRAATYGRGIWQAPLKTP
jgi:photosystem II stability/assembly factor-like uncharacterized protein